MNKQLLKDKVARQQFLFKKFDEYFNIQYSQETFVKKDFPEILFKVIKLYDDSIESQNLVFLENVKPVYMTLGSIEKDIKNRPNRLYYNTKFRRKHLNNVQEYFFQNMYLNLIIQKSDVYEKDELIKQVVQDVYEYYKLTKNVIAKAFSNVIYGISVGGCIKILKPKIDLQDYIAQKTLEIKNIVISSFKSSLLYYDTDTFYLSLDPSISDNNHEILIKQIEEKTNLKLVKGEKYSHFGYFGYKEMWKVK
jgi:hypothetical protein